MDDDDKVIAERSWAAFMIAAELLVASLSSCSSEISGDCISGYSLYPFLDRIFNCNELCDLENRINR